MKIINEYSNKKHSDIITQNKVFILIALATGLILLIPFAAMKVTSDVNWDETDFIVMGTLLFGTGSIFVIVARKVNKKHRIIIGTALIILLLYLWTELAVGIFTNWGS